MVANIPWVCANDEDTTDDEEDWCDDTIDDEDEDLSIWKRNPILSSPLEINTWPHNSHSTRILKASKVFASDDDEDPSPIALSEWTYEH